MQQLKRYGHASRIENLTAIGMPDVSYCIRGVEGFIENKFLLDWPRRPDTPVYLRRFTTQQRLWISERARAGGRAYVMLYVQKPVLNVLLFDGAWAAKHLGTMTRDALCMHALVHCEERVVWPRVIDAITAPLTRVHN
jgi:hypothetical protein